MGEVKQEIHFHGPVDNHGTIGDARHHYTEINISIPTEEDLAKVISELRKNPAEESLAAAANIEEAKTAIAKGDEVGAKSFFKKAGKWALDAATKIGVTVAAEAIKHSMGLSGQG